MLPTGRALVLHHCRMMHSWNELLVPPHSICSYCSVIHLSQILSVVVLTVKPKAYSSQPIDIFGTTATSFSGQVDTGEKQKEKPSKQRMLIAGVE